MSAGLSKLRLAQLASQARRPDIASLHRVSTSAQASLKRSPVCAELPDEAATGGVGVAVKALPVAVEADEVRRVELEVFLGHVHLLSICHQLS